MDRLSLPNSPPVGFGVNGVGDAAPIVRQLQERPAAERSIQRLPDGILRRPALALQALQQDPVVEEFVLGNGREGSLPLRGEPEGPQGYFQLSEIVNALQQYAQEGIGNWRCANAAGESLKFPTGQHKGSAIPRGSHQNSPCRATRDSNRTRLSRNRRRTLPVGPWRCLARMSSAMLRG